MMMLMMLLLMMMAVMIKDIKYGESVDEKRKQ